LRSNRENQSGNDRQQEFNTFHRFSNGDVNDRNSGEIFMVYTRPAPRTANASHANPMPHVPDKAVNSIDKNAGIKSSCKNQALYE
jgi:hypothetical protein